ncbi:hypothetical protein BC835DRAFT_937298 [Cytidiella melzeri]|nr:hypothetical protein BC835DRAFT_937298 [Cytidiella melzeri]
MHHCHHRRSPSCDDNFLTIPPSPGRSQPPTNNDHRMRTPPVTQTTAGSCTFSPPARMPYHNDITMRTPDSSPERRPVARESRHHPYQRPVERTAMRTVGNSGGFQSIPPPGLQFDPRSQNRAKLSASPAKMKYPRPPSPRSSSSQRPVGGVGSPSKMQCDSNLPAQDATQAQGAPRPLNITDDESRGILVVAKNARPTATPAQTNGTTAQVSPTPPSDDSSRSTPHRSRRPETDAASLHTSTKDVQVITNGPRDDACIRTFLQACGFMEPLCDKYLRIFNHLGIYSHHDLDLLINNNLRESFADLLRKFHDIRWLHLTCIMKQLEDYESRQKKGDGSK